MTVVRHWGSRDQTSCHTPHKLHDVMVSIKPDNSFNVKHYFTSPFIMKYYLFKGTNVPKRTFWISFFFFWTLKYINLKHQKKKINYVVFHGFSNLFHVTPVKLSSDTRTKTDSDPSPVLWYPQPTLPFPPPVHVSVQGFRCATFRLYSFRLKTV